MKIAIISDTHSLLRDEVMEKIRECEIILHGGDIAPAAKRDGYNH